jgi:hypothetical protein
MATFDTVREIALSLPGVEEGTSYGTAAFRVRGKFLARLREDGETLALRIGMDATRRSSSALGDSARRSRGCSGTGVGLGGTREAAAPITERALRQNQA